jgi:prolyl-tRNA synthetase
MNVSFLAEDGKLQTVEMGCYGIGVTRIVAAAIEQNYDERGIVFPSALAPFQAAIVPIGASKNVAVRAAAERLHDDLVAAGIDTLLDDRNERPGVMFADMDLIGIPHRIVVGERGLESGQYEYKGRSEAKAVSIPAAEILPFICARAGAAQ